jgi:hypothetical protein
MAEKQWVKLNTNTKYEYITSPRVYGGRINRIGASLVEQWERQGLEWRPTDPTPIEGGPTLNELKALGYIGVELLKEVE